MVYKIFRVVKQHHIFVVGVVFQVVKNNIFFLFVSFFPIQFPGAIFRSGDRGRKVYLRGLYVGAEVSTTTVTRICFFFSRVDVCQPSSSLCPAALFCFLAISARTSFRPRFAVSTTCSKITPSPFYSGWAYVVTLVY